MSAHTYTHKHKIARGKIENLNISIKKKKERKEIEINRTKHIIKYYLIHLYMRFKKFKCLNNLLFLFYRKNCGLDKRSASNSNLKETLCLTRHKSNPIFP